ncbi:MAG: hypothetical protein ACFFCS_25365, partial [Candidatus Hodarchaeota archaeon]
MLEVEDKDPTSEGNEALRVIHKYRSNICGMGPVFDKFINNALKSGEKRGEIATAVSRFFNTAYFNKEGENNFPHPSSQMLGIRVYQGKCEGVKCELAGNGETLLGIIPCQVHFEINNGLSNKLELDDFYFKKIAKDNKTIKITYNCAVETVFFKV